jgi:Zn-dependent peptidase ImmA (M78 family)
MRNRRDIELEARELLENNSVSRPPVPVDELAAALDIDLRFSAANDDVSGALIRSGSSVVIAVNSAQHENRQRFTIAHEIGHFLLHKGTKVHFDDDFRVNYRKADTTGVAAVDEMEANWFAAALLMPKSFLKKDWLRLRLENDTAFGAIQSLAVRYRVSAKAMELRLVNLGFVSPVE